MTNEDTDARRRRLQALREKHARQTSDDVPSEPEETPASGDRAGGLAGRGAGLGLGGGRPGPLGGGRRRRGGGMRRAGAAEGQGRGESVQRLLKFLTQPGPGGRLIPGTSIKEDRIKQVMQFLRHRANNAEGQNAKRLQRAVAFLTREQEGVPMVAGVNVAHLQKLVALLQGRAGRDAAAGGGGEELDGVFEELVEERTAPAAAAPVQQPDPAIASTLSELVGITQRLSEQLEATQRQVREMAQERAVAPEPEEAEEEQEQLQKAKRPGGDWFEEFLE